MNRPFLIPLFAMIAGLSLAGLRSCFLPQVIIFPLLGVALATLLLRPRLPFLLAVAALFFLWGDLALKPFVAPEFPPDHIVRHASSEPIVVEGIIDARPDRTETGCRVYLRTDRVIRPHVAIPVSGRIVLSVEQGRGSFLTGDRIRFASRIRIPRNYGLPGEFDYVRFLAFRSVFATAYVKTSDDVIVMREGEAFPWQRRIDAISERIGSFIALHTGTEEGAILKALLLGDSGQISRELKNAYARTGVNHILSISGFHISIIALCLFQLFFFVGKRSETFLLYCNARSLALLATLPVIVFYLFLTGAAPATLRSVIMIAAGIVALTIERETDAINTLMLAAVVILCLSPMALFDISFQLSFLALWGIIVLTPLYMRPFAAMSEGNGKKLVTFLMASATAISATILPAAYYFHRTSLTGLVSNFFIVPIVGYGAVVCGFCALPFVFIAPPLARLMLAMAAWLVKIADAIIVWLAKLPLLPVFVPTQPTLALSFCFLAALTFMKPGRLRVAGCSMLAAAILLVSLVPGAFCRNSGGLTVTFFSVGQGESTLITFPDGRHMLVDGGGNTGESGRDVGERLLAPALWTLGVDSLDYVVLTHPHPDHLQGLKYVVANFRVGEFWEGSSDDESDDYRELKRILADKHIPVRMVNEQTPPVQIGRCRIDVLAPFARNGLETAISFRDVNDESVVFRLSLADFSVLFTGDIGFATEQRLAEKPERLRCTILKVPHHGSAYSSSPVFLAAATAKTAVISAGYGNSFHLPARKTLDALQRCSIDVYRTDYDGTIIVTADKRGENVVLNRTNKAFSLTKF